MKPPDTEGPCPWGGATGRAEGPEALPVRVPSELGGGPAEGAGRFLRAVGPEPHSLGVDAVQAQGPPAFLGVGLVDRSRGDVAEGTEEGGRRLEGHHVLLS